MRASHRFAGRGVALSLLAPLALAVACATSPLGRKQLLLVPGGQVDQMGVQSFDQLKGQTAIETDPAINAYVKCITGPITAQTQGKVDVSNWEVVVFRDKQINAFALPGGKIGVYTGILPVTKSDAQLAAVLGHEVGHVIAHHGQERVSTAAVTQLGEGIVGAFLAGQVQNPTERALLLGAIGLGANMGISLPFSRTQESEADLIGLKLMAQAGFDPSQAIELWKNMAAAAGNGPPAILSDHPSNQQRIDGLQSQLPDAESVYRQVKASGGGHSCPRPPGI